MAGPSLEADLAVTMTRASWPALGSLLTRALGPVACHSALVECYLATRRGGSILMDTAEIMKTLQQLPLICLLQENKLIWQLHWFSEFMLFYFLLGGSSSKCQLPVHFYTFEILWPLRSVTNCCLSIHRLVHRQGSKTETRVGLILFP